jgi:uncharacterized protein
MESFSGAELGKGFDLETALDWGLLPFVCNEPAAAADILAAYVNTYLKEELQAEGIIRNVPPFVRFLSVAGQVNGQIVNALNIAREVSVARSTVDTYFAVLSDTLVGHMLRPWRPGLKAPVKTGGVLRMKEPCGEGVATHTGPESCGWTSNGVAEALTGVRTDQR